MAGLAALLFQEADSVDAHAPIHRLAHVVDGEQADRNRGQRFHLDAGAAVAFGGYFAVDGQVCRIRCEFGGDPGQCDGVAKGDQFAGALGGLDCSDARDSEDIALLGRSGKDEFKGGRFHIDGTAGTGDPGGLALAADIDHVGLAGGIEMGEGRRQAWLPSVTGARRRAAGQWDIIASMRLSQRLVALALAAVLVVPPVRGDDLPDLGEASAGDLSPATEKKIGQQIMHEFRWRDPSYLDDPDVESYLNQLGGRLAAASNDPGIGFYFFGVNDPSINAFAMPGGFIGVNSGLLLASQSESELAGVLAHEISHVTQRHIARQVMREKQLSMGTMLAMVIGLLAARSNSQVASATIAGAQAGAISAQLGYSRDFEREADRSGFDVLKKAGFDVRGMSLFFERLQRASRVYENNAPVYLRTHPVTGERISDMQNREQAVPYRQVPDSLDFQLVRAKLRAKQGTPGEAVKELQALVGDRKFASEAAARFGLAVALGRNRDWVGAEAQIDALKKLKAQSPMIDHLLADARIGQGDAAGGLAVYRDAMTRFPTNYALVYGYGDALTSQKRYAESLQFAESQLQLYPEDVRLHKLRAESYAGLGRRAQQHRALAEVFALQGQTPAAVEQLQLAQRAGDANFYELSVIDARLREMKKRQEDEMKEKRRW